MNRWRVMGYDTFARESYCVGEYTSETEALAELELRLAGEDEGTLKQAMENLDRTCGFYVERRMNRSIQDAMAGHKVVEFLS